MKIKMREKSTINNLKLIVAKKLMISKENVRLWIGDNETTGHKKLMDIGLMDGAILEARIDNAGGQIEGVKDNKEVRPGEEQHHYYS